jgi:hypothetical protein
VAQVFSNLKDSHPHIFDAADLQHQYRHFKSINNDSLEKQFHEDNNFRTSVRGIKVRGVYDTIAEAKNRADQLKKKGDKFDIFIGQVGCWCPWSPNPEDIADSTYAETKLNTFMKQFKENVSLRDQVFEERKSEKMKVTSAPTIEEIQESIVDKQDPWIDSKTEN